MEKGKIQRKKWKQENLAIWQEMAKYGRKARRPEIPGQIIETNLISYIFFCDVMFAFIFVLPRM